MDFRVFEFGNPVGLAAVGLLLALAGCQSSDTLDVSGAGTGTSGGVQAQQPGQITEAELRAYCPAMTLRSTSAVHNVYARNGDGDPTQLVYRAAIMDTTRSCSYGPGTMGMTFAIAGRVIPGPLGTPGTLTLPVEITVYQNQDVIYSQTFNQQVAVNDTAGATQFMFTDTNFTMPTPTSANVRVFVGFANGSATR